VVCENAEQAERPLISAAKAGSWNEITGMVVQVWSVSRLNKVIALLESRSRKAVGNATNRQPLEYGGYIEPNGRCDISASRGLPAAAIKDWLSDY
jgi:hypothetical protein